MKLFRTGLTLLLVAFALGALAQETVSGTKPGWTVAKPSSTCPADGKRAPKAYPATGR